MQGFYGALVYHGVSIAYGGDAAIADKDAWIADWVALVTQVLQSDSCKVSSGCMRCICKSAVLLRLGLHAKSNPNERRGQRVHGMYAVFLQMGCPNWDVTIFACRIAACACRRLWLDLCRGDQQRLTACRTG